MYPSRTASGRSSSGLVYARMDVPSAREIADRWKYPPPYDFYDMTADPEDHQEFVTPSLWPDLFLQVRRDGHLFGFLSGSLVDAGGAVEIGLGMHPGLVGLGLGTTFMRHNLSRVQEAYPGAEICLSVASFDQRAIKVYRKSGFHVVRRFVQKTNGGEHDFVAMRYQA